MKPKRGWFTKHAGGTALVAGLLLVAMPLGLFISFGDPSAGYQWSRAVSASFAVGVAGFVAVAALGQYLRNSHDKRVERSMLFWRRANEKAFTDNHSKFIEYSHGNGWEAPDFQKLGASDANGRDHRLAVEYLLDFYDEACCAVMVGACDEEAMCFYLGPLMRRQKEQLADFIVAWQNKHKRPEKWDCFTTTVDGWSQDERLAKFFGPITSANRN